MALLYIVFDRLQLRMDKLMRGTKSSEPGKVSSGRFDPAVLDQPARTVFRQRGSEGAGAKSTYVSGQKNTPMRKKISGTN